MWKTTNDGQSWDKISPDLTLADPETLGKTGGVITMDMNGPEIYATVFALVPSFHDVNTIWAGSDDGLVHVTRDGVKNWSNITPPDMENFSRVSIIDESRHSPGTAYVAANRYQVDDREPYVWRTRDYGKTWTKIVDGVQPGHFARAVRETRFERGSCFWAPSTVPMFPSTPATAGNRFSSTFPTLRSLGRLPLLNLKSGEFAAGGAYHNYDMLNLGGTYSCRKSGLYPTYGTRARRYPGSATKQESPFSLLKMGRVT